MAHENGIIWDDRPSDPNGGVSIYDVQQVFNVSYDNLKELCTNENINCWAKYKPVILQKQVGGVVSANVEATGKSSVTTTNKWYRGNFLNNATGLNYDCGFLIYRYNNLNAFLTDFKSSNPSHIAWYRQLPRTNSSLDGYRLSDFDGYMHSAYKFYGDPRILSTEFRTSQDIVFSFTSVPTSYNADKLLSWGDFTYLGDCYLGVVIWNDSITKVKTMSTKIGSSSNPTITVSGLPVGDYKATYFLSTNSQTSLSNSTSVGNVFSLGYTTPLSFKVVEYVDTWIEIDLEEDTSIGYHGLYYQRNSADNGFEFQVRFKTHRYNTGNYNNNTQVAIYKVTMQLQYAGGFAIQSPHVGEGLKVDYIPNTTTSIENHRISLSSPIVMDCPTTSGGVERTGIITFSLLDTMWQGNTVKFDYITISAKLGTVTWNDISNEAYTASDSIRKAVPEYPNENGSSSGYISEDSDYEQVIWNEGGGNTGGGPDVDPPGYIVNEP